MELYGCKDEELGHYTCFRASRKIDINNILDDRIWQDALEKFDQNEFDLRSRNVDVLGGFRDFRYEKHPRGKRWAFMDWDFPELQTTVKVDGTLNDSSDVDKGWSAGLIFPRMKPWLAFLERLSPRNHKKLDFCRADLVPPSSILQNV